MTPCHVGRLTPIFRNEYNVRQRTMRQSEIEPLCKAGSQSHILLSDRPAQSAPIAG